MKCPYCHSENVDRANFCHACGHALRRMAPAEKPPVGAAHRQRREHLHQRSQAREFQRDPQRDFHTRGAAAREPHASSLEDPLADVIPQTSTDARREPQLNAQPDPRAAYAERMGQPDQTHESRFASFASREEYPHNRVGMMHFIWMSLMIIALLLAGMAAAVWMRPAFLPQGIALMMHIPQMLGIEKIDPRSKKIPTKFGTSQGELPYDGKFLEETTNRIPATNVSIATLPVQQNSSGSSAAGKSDAAATDHADVAPADTVTPVTVEPAAAPTPETQTQSPSAGNKDNETASTVKLTVSENAELKRSEPVKADIVSSVKSKPKKKRVSPALRKKEIDRLRDQAQVELYSH